MTTEETTCGVSDIKEAKKAIADAFKRTGLIREGYTGEVTVGLTNGGIMFIRKSETLK